MKRFLAFVVLAFATTAATANQSPGNWICEDPLFVQDAILEIEGRIFKSATDLEVEAETYKILGLTRIWTIDENKEIIFRIEPDGSGTYIFTGEHDIFFQCRATK